MVPLFSQDIMDKSYLCLGLEVVAWTFNSCYLRDEGRMIIVQGQPTQKRDTFW
jgi:hypothetical protein